MKRRKRRYTLKARGEQMAGTRARIVDATVALHEEVGPRGTTISAIAERAGVERLTVYRHFPDESAVFAACSHRFMELNPPPDPASWQSESDGRRRAHAALSAVYGQFSRTQRMLRQIYRDVEAYPALQKIMDGFDAYLDEIARDLAAAWAVGRPGVRISATWGHAVRFSTWDSLEAQGLADGAKVDLVLRWAGGVAR